MIYIETTCPLGLGMKGRFFFNWAFLVGLAIFMLLGGCVSIPSDLQKNFSDFHPQSLEDFPRQPGMEWWYQGKILEDDFESSYINRSRIEGEKLIQGVPLIVFSETNQQGNGEVDSYVQLDETGVVYYGSTLEDVLEEQLVPFHLFQFPIQVGHSFQQVDKRNLDFGEDLDGDGQDETVDCKSKVTVVRTDSVAVPAGIYSEAVLIKTHGDMTVHLSSNRKTAPADFTIMEWYVKGIGRVKTNFSMRVFVPIFGITKKFTYKTNEVLLGVRSHGVTH